MKAELDLLVRTTEPERAILNLIGRVADEEQCSAYVVGGYVRDLILDRPRVDIDVVTEGSGIHLAEAFAKALPYQPQVNIFKRYGTAMVKTKNFEVEFVGARKESYNWDSRKPIVESGTLEDDQLRRDFTINAMAIQLNKKEKTGVLIDPFEGMRDLHLELIRTPTDPDRTFSDDPLRMMRAIRFATQLDFEIETSTFASIQRNKTRIEIISAERIQSELGKIIRSDQPSKGFKLLDESGLLALIFPQMTRLKGVEVIDGISHKDNFYHTLEVLDNVAGVSDNYWLRWAAILHDIAKPQTKRFVEGIGWTFHGHDAVGAQMVPKIFKRFRLPLDHKMKYVQKLVAMHLRPISLTKENISDSAIRRLLVDAGDDLEDLMMLCEADITSKNPKRVLRYLENYAMVRERLVEIEEKDHLRNWQPPIDGQEIMETFDIKPSKTIGHIKNAIKEAILEGDIENNYASAHAFMLKKGEELGLQVRNSL